MKNVSKLTQEEIKKLKEKKKKLVKENAKIKK